MSTQVKRVGIVGAGYISDYHARAIARETNAELVAICDMNVQLANKLLAYGPDASIYSDYQAMLAEQSLDVVHVLTQPDSHHHLARIAIEAGCNVILEKPVTVNAAQAIELQQLAEQHNVQLAVNHNFLFSRPFNQLKRVLDDGSLGPIKSIRVVWKKSLAQVTHGPWTLWMLREPSNILFETGSHSLSEVLAVVGAPEVVSVSAQVPTVLPSGSTFYQRWSVALKVGDIAIQVDKFFDSGYEQHIVEVEGVFGIARADIENDVFSLEQSTGLSYDSERLSINARIGLARTKQAVSTFASYLGSKFFKSALGAPYESSMLASLANCYRQLDGNPEGPYSSIDYAIRIAGLAEAVANHLPAAIREPEKLPSTIPDFVTAPSKQAKILIIGASGFIGSRLLASLQHDARGVRALVRNPSALNGISLGKNCEILVGDYRTEEVIEKALDGVEIVFHLAVAHGNSLAAYLRADSDPTVALARRCQQSGVQRFIYTGTIDSLYLGPGAGLVKESDGVDKQITRRNNYAHSKAITEQRLMELHHSEGFPLVIIRPAIVLGAGGPVMHLGVANWFGLGRCQFWGQGDNLLPAILVGDVVKGLVAAMDAADIEGNIYNLSAEPCFSARQYVAEVESTLGVKIASAASNARKSFIVDFLKWGIKVLARHPDKSRIPSVRDWQCREQHASFDTSQAQRDLQWTPENDRQIIMEKGIREPARAAL